MNWVRKLRPANLSVEAPGIHLNAGPRSAQGGIWETHPALGRANFDSTFPWTGSNSATIAERSRHRKGERRYREPDLSWERWALIAAVHSFYPERPDTHLVVLHVNNQTARIPFGECRKTQTGWPQPSVEPQKHAPNRRPTSPGKCGRSGPTTVKRGLAKKGC